ncbi:MAG: phenylacetate-CoA oxygenase subunit PaaI [Chitinophagaceae bacterium]|nr:MAG: phenylacetate-CoA oxygenase subunit PaaI [Chitinophagaceae bacterium]
MTANKQLCDFVLHLADNALILGHRNSEWTGHGPILEQDIALSNIALDLIGQARHLYQYAALLLNDGASEDSLAYLRNDRQFMNCLLAEQPNGDWGQTITRQFLFSAWQWYYYQQLQNGNDHQIAAIASKSLKEVAYHLRWSSEWVIRLGDGTAESHQRMQQALDTLWPFTGELTTPADYEKEVQTIVLDFDTIAQSYEQKVAGILKKATLTAPTSTWMQHGGKKGIHTEHMGYLLAEMQVLQRMYPGVEW